MRNDLLKRILVAFAPHVSRFAHRVSRRSSALHSTLRVFMACVTFLTLTLTIMHRDDADGYQASHLFFMPRQNWEMDRGRGMLHEPEYYERMDLEALAEEVFGNYRIREPEAEETLNAPAPEAHATETRAYRDWLAQQQQDYTSWFQRTHGPYEQWLDREALSFDGWLYQQSAEYRRQFEDERAAQGSSGQFIAEFDEYPSDNEEGLAPTKGRTQGQTVRRAPDVPNLSSNQLPVAESYEAREPDSWQFSDLGMPFVTPTIWQRDIPTLPPRRQVIL